MDKRTKNKLAAKRRKQEAALKKLTDDREIGTWAVIEAIRHGNQYVRQVLRRNMVMEGLEAFVLNEEEELLLRAAKGLTEKLCRFKDPDEQKRIRSLPLDELHARYQLKKQFDAVIGQMTAHEILQAMGGSF